METAHRVLRDHSQRQEQHRRQEPPEPGPEPPPAAEPPPVASGDLRLVKSVSESHTPGPAGGLGASGWRSCRRGALPRGDREGPVPWQQGHIWGASSRHRRLPGGRSSASSVPGSASPADGRLAPGSGGRRGCSDTARALLGAGWPLSRGIPSRASPAARAEGAPPLAAAGAASRDTGVGSGCAVCGPVRTVPQPAGTPRPSSPRLTRCTCCAEGLGGGTPVPEHPPRACAVGWADPGGGVSCPLWPLLEGSSAPGSRGRVSGRVWLSRDGQGCCATSLVPRMGRPRGRPAGPALQRVLQSSGH